MTTCGAGPDPSLNEADTHTLSPVAGTEFFPNMLVPSDAGPIGRRSTRAPSRVCRPFQTVAVALIESWGTFPEPLSSIAPGRQRGRYSWANIVRSAPTALSPVNGRWGVWTVASPLIPLV